MLDVLQRARESWSRPALPAGPPSSYEGVGTALEALRQKRRAAEVLFQADCPAEALHTTGEALRAIDTLAGALATKLAKHAASTEATLRECGVPASAVDDFVTLRAVGAIPATDDTIVEQDVQRLHGALRVCRVVESAIADVNRPPRERTRGLIAHGAIGLIFALIAVSQIWLAQLELERYPSASASATERKLETRYGPQNLVDLHPDTEWLGEAVPAWVDLKFRSPRAIKAVLVRNGHNPPWNDRATKDFHVELYRRDRLLARASAQFPELELVSLPVAVKVHAERVDRVRLVVDSVHGLGASLAEIEIQ
ncbi:MAG TPA: hypothetical protein VFX59_11930 [Polyangiales bacterium]|nr:hypothetical protein [Polyangiales bacterium]